MWSCGFGSQERMARPLAASGSARVDWPCFSPSWGDRVPSQWHLFFPTNHHLSALRSPRFPYWGSEFPWFSGGEDQQKKNLWILDQNFWTIPVNWPHSSLPDFPWNMLTLQSPPHRSTAPAPPTAPIFFCSSGALTRRCRAAASARSANIVRKAQLTTKRNQPQQGKGLKMVLGWWLVNG